MNTLIKISLIASIVSVFSGCGVRDLTESEAIGNYTCFDSTMFGVGTDKTKDQFKYIIKGSGSFTRIAYNGYKTYGSWELSGTRILLTDIGETRYSDTISYHDYDKPEIRQFFGDALSQRTCIKE